MTIRKWKTGGRFVLLGFVVTAFSALGMTCGGGVITPTCGNGAVEAGEQCDDGNTVSGDGCSATCQTEAPAPRCGDGTVDAGEQCDDGNTVSGDGCSATCQNEVAPPQCGNGTVDAGEQCDDGNTAGGDGCSATCQIETVCGDGTCDAGETAASCPADCAPVLFVAGFLGNNVVSFTDDGTINGNITPDTNLFGPSTGLNQPADIIVTQNGSLLAPDFTGPAGAGPGSLTRYSNALSATANTPFDGQLSGGATQLNGPASLTVNAAQDLVFVANFNSNVISVYNNASTVNGNTAPIRTIFTTVSTPPITSPTGINFGVGSDDLYIANSAPAGGSVFVYSNASSRNGDLAPDRVITSAAFTGIFDVFVDGNDNLFVVNNLAGVGSIIIFKNASTLNGPLPVTPDFTLTVPGAGSVLTAIVVGSDGKGYIVDNVAAGRVLIYNNVATRNGTIAPDRTITGSNTKLTSPIRAFLLEP